jgi:hypothetical protein
MADQIDKECRKAACFLRQCFEKRNEKIWSYSTSILYLEHGKHRKRLFW